MKAARGLRLEVQQAGPIPLQAALDCAPGEVVALVGPSGAGKTSLLHVVAGLLRPAAGCLQVAGETWWDAARGVHVSPQARRVGLVFQQYALMPHLDAIGNVALAMGHLPRGARAAAAAEWLSRLGLGRAEQSRRPSALSGGQQQRVAMARALAREPRVLLLDEPFSAVDLQSREALYAQITALRGELGIPILMVTHDLREARALADRLVVVDRGAVLQAGPPDALDAAPGSLRVARLLDHPNVFDGAWHGSDGGVPAGLEWRVDGRSVGPLAVALPAHAVAGGHAGWCVAPDAVHLHASPVAGAFPVRVLDDRGSDEGRRLTVAFDDAGERRVRIAPSAADTRRRAAGEQAYLRIDATRIRLLPTDASDAPGTLPGGAGR